VLPLLSRLAVVAWGRQGGAAGERLLGAWPASMARGCDAAAYNFLLLEVVLGVRVAPIFWRPGSVVEEGRRQAGALLHASRSRELISGGFGGLFCRPSGIRG
jgi:hypothetical protein